MTSDAERRLNERGVRLEEKDFGREPAIHGYLVLWPAEGGAHVVAEIRPGLTDKQREQQAEWVEEKIDRFLEHGPEPDGWQKRQSDDGWQLWAREVWLPRLTDPQHDG